MAAEPGSTRPAAAARRPARPRPGPAHAPPPPTPAADLARQAVETPSATALVRDGGRLTYRQLEARAAGLAVHLRARAATGPAATGRRSQAVPVTATLCATPGPDAVAALFALWKAGYAAVPLHQRLTPSEIDHARQTVNASLHIDNQSLHELLRDSGGAPREDQAEVARPGRHPSAHPDVIAYILTSGSTGPPRAFGFTRDTFAASSTAVTSRLGLGPGDRWGLCLSPGHIGGLSLIVRSVMTGASVRLWPTFDALAVTRAILSGEVTHLAIVPTMLRRILARLRDRPVPETLRCVLVGGAAAPRALLDRAWAAGLPIATTWGMTETASQVATAPPALARRHPGTSGPPLPGIEVRPGPGGTLQVRGPTLASAMIPGPGATPRPLPTGPHGWFTTRDLGRIDPDGLIWIEGRAGAIIVSGGLNVSPGDVERVIEALPGIREAVVLGLPDEEWGEVVAAVVEADPAAVTPAGVDRHCREHLVRGRCPTRIVVVDELPRTWTGKVLRPKVKERLAPEPAPAPHRRPGSSTNPMETT